MRQEATHTELTRAIIAAPQNIKSPAYGVVPFHEGTLPAS